MTWMLVHLFLENFHLLYFIELDSDFQLYSFVVLKFFVIPTFVLGVMLWVHVVFLHFILF